MYFTESILNTLKADKIISESKLKGLRSSSTATLYDIKLEELNLDRIEKRLIKNTENIKSYTNEINLAGTSRLVGGCLRNDNVHVRVRYQSHWIPNRQQELECHNVNFE